MYDLLAPLTFATAFFGFSMGTIAALVAAWIIMEQQAKHMSRALLQNKAGSPDGSSKVDAGGHAADIGTTGSAAATSAATGIPAELALLMQEQMALRVQVEARDASLVDAKRELDGMKRSAAATAQQLYDHGRQLTITLENLQQIRADLSREKSQHGETRVLLEARRVEFERAQARVRQLQSNNFQVRIVAMVSQLDREAVHLAGVMAHELVDKFVVAARQQTVTINVFGGDSNVTRTVLRLALRGSIAMWYDSLIRAWPSEKNIERVKIALYNCLGEEVDELQSERWMAFTGGYLRRMLHQDHHDPDEGQLEELTNFCTAQLIQRIVDVLVLFHQDRSPPRTVGDSGLSTLDYWAIGQVTDTFISSDQESILRLKVALRDALELRRAAAVGITEAELEAFRARRSRRSLGGTEDNLWLPGGFMFSE